MNGKLGKIFSRTATPQDAEPLGEDMVPSPDAIAERSALTEPKEKSDPKAAHGPFASSALAPVRDFTG